MRVRHVARTVGASAAVACIGGLSLFAFAGSAGADVPPGGQTNAAVPISPDPTSGQTVTPGTPFSSGQVITVAVPPETTLTPNAGVRIIECAAPNGVLPTLPSQCDPTTIQGESVIPAADGSFAIHDYQLFALPDVVSLGESPTGSPKCGDTAATECVLFIGDNYNDFTAPHIFSQVFKITPNASDNGVNPGDGTPELPLAIGLPFAAAGIMGGVFYRRRHTAKSAA
jgi:hypothetical protein